MLLGCSISCVPGADIDAWSAVSKTRMAGRPYRNVRADSVCDDDIWSGTATGSRHFVLHFAFDPSSDVVLGHVRDLSAARR